MPSIVLEATWANAGATVIIYLAALTGVPPELYEAAEVDGASIWRKVWHITLPQLRGVLLVTLILQLIGTAQVFTEPFLFTGGGPANSTMTVLLLIYRYAFQNSLGGDYGMAAALSLMLAAFLAVFTAGLLPADPVVEHDVVIRPSRRRCARRGRRVAGARDRARAPTGASGRVALVAAALHGAILVFLLSSGSGRSCGWSSRRSRRPRTRCAMPMALWPNGVDLAHLVTAWTRTQSIATSATRS